MMSNKSLAAALALLLVIVTNSERQMGLFNASAFSGPTLTCCPHHLRIYGAFPKFWMAVSDEDSQDDSQPVPPNDTDAATEETDALQKQLNGLNRQSEQLGRLVEERQKEVDERRKEHDELRKEMDEMNRRLDGLFPAFMPQTKIALLETAVYKFVSTDNEHVCQVSATLMQDILVMLVESGEEGNPKQLSLDINSALVPDPVSGQEKLLYIREGLAALATFIKQEDIVQQDLQDWPPGRGPLTHGGNLLSALYSPQQSQDDIEPGELSRQQVSAMRANFENLSRSDRRGVLSDPADGLNAVVDALDSRNVTVSVAAKTDTMAKLAALCENF